MIGVAFWLSACMLAAPAPWAFADNAIEPSTSAAAAKVKVSFFINPPHVCRMPKRADDHDAATTRRSLTRPGVRGPIRPTGRLVRSRRGFGSDLPAADRELCDFAKPSRGCGRCLTRRAVLVDALGEPCPGLRHVEKGDFAGRIRDALGYFSTIHRIEPVAGSHFPRRHSPHPTMHYDIFATRKRRLWFPAGAGVSANFRFVRISGSVG